MLKTKAALQDCSKRGVKLCGNETLNHDNRSTRINNILVIIRFFSNVYLKVNSEVIGKQGIHPASPEKSWAAFLYKILVLVLYVILCPALFLHPLTHFFAP